MNPMSGPFVIVVAPNVALAVLLRYRHRVPLSCGLQSKVSANGIGIASIWRPNQKLNPTGNDYGYRDGFVVGHGHWQSALGRS